MQILFQADLESSMNFEKNRKELLEQLSHRRRDKSTQRKSASAKSATKSKPTVSQEAGPSKKIRKNILLYGLDSIFLRNILQTLKSTYSVSSFDNSDDACKSCLDNNISDVLLDMDTPTDWKMSTDVFTTVRTLHPDVKFYLFTKDRRSVPVQTLVAQGGILMPKPVHFEELYAELDK